MQGTVTEQVGTDCFLRNVYIVHFQSFCTQRLSSGFHHKILLKSDTNVYLADGSALCPLALNTCLLTPASEQKTPEITQASMMHS